MPNGIITVDSPQSVTQNYDDCSTNCDVVVVLRSMNATLIDMSIEAICESEKWQEKYYSHMGAMTVLCIAVGIFAVCLGVAIGGA